MSKSLQFLVAFFGLLALSHAQADSTTDLSCLRVRVAIDAGSSSAKLQSAIVNVCEHRIVRLLAKDKAKVNWRDELYRDGTDMTIRPEFANKGFATIKATLDKVIEATHKALADEKNKEFAALDRTEFEHAGGGTAAIRDAKNRAQIIAAIRNNELNLRPLIQAEEGHLGYLSIYGKLADKPDFDADPSHFLSWDIGSTSMQVVGFFSHEADKPRGWDTVLGNRTGNDLLKAVLSNFADEKSEKSSPNPILKDNDADVEAKLYANAEAFAKADADIKKYLFNKKNLWVKNRLQSGEPVKVYGIGGSHSGVLSVLKKVPGKEKAKGFSQEDLKALLDDVLHASDDDLKAKYDVAPEYQKGTPTNILFTYTMMKILDIKEVEVVDTDNTLGLLITEAYWKKVDNASMKAEKTLRP